MTKDFTHSVLILILSTLAAASFSLLVWVVPNVLRTADIAKGSLAVPLTLSTRGRDITLVKDVSHTNTATRTRNWRNGRPTRVRRHL